MEVKNEQKKLISIIITLCSLFLLLILSVSTFAWMSTNRKLYTTGASIAVNKNSDLGIYRFMILKREGADKAKDVSGSGTIVLTEYDTVFIDKNVNTSIIMRLELGNLPYDEETGKYLPFHLRVRCGGADEYLRSMEGYTSEKAQEMEDTWVESGAFLPSEYWETEDGLTQVLSNIICVRSGLGDSTLNALTDTNDIYSNAKTYLATPNEKIVLGEQVFLNSTATEKKGILEFEFEHYDDYVNDGMVVVYIDINYSDPLIVLFSTQLGFSTSSSEDTTSTEESVHFTSDLTNCFIFLGDDKE